MHRIWHIPFLPFPGFAPLNKKKKFKVSQKKMSKRKLEEDLNGSSKKPNQSRKQSDGTYEIFTTTSWSGGRLDRGVLNLEEKMRIADLTKMLADRTALAPFQLRFDLVQFNGRRKDLTGLAAASDQQLVSEVIALDCFSSIHLWHPKWRSTSDFLRR
jgi:hypothetical protein